MVFLYCKIVTLSFNLWHSEECDWSYTRIIMLSNFRHLFNPKALLKLFVNYFTIKFKELHIYIPMCLLIYH